MKAPGFVIALAGGALAILAVAVFALDDETLFVSPPQAVANELLHAISLDRTGPVQRLMSREAQRTTPPRDVHRVVSAFRARVGRVRHTEAEVVERRGDTAVVRVSVEGERARPELLVRLVRQDGVWSAARLDDVLPHESTGTPNQSGR